MNIIEILFNLLYLRQKIAAIFDNPMYVQKQKRHFELEIFGIRY